MTRDDPTLARWTTLAAVALAACSGALSVEDPKPDGSGGATGGTSGGVGGTGSDAQRFTGNDPACPAGAPVESDPCDLTEGTICSFMTPNPGTPGYDDGALCGCWAAAGGTLRWACYWRGSNSSGCPEAEPANGSSCSGLIFATCSYPERTSCSCLGPSAVWSCATTKVADVPWLPDSLDPTVPVNELSAEERSDFCAWFATSRYAGTFEDGPASVDENGYVVAACSTCAGAAQAAIPSISREQCVANLGFSSCAAPLAELADCVSSMYDGCFPRERGCAPYLDHEGCSGTLLNAWNMGAAGTTATGGTGGSGDTGGTGPTGNEDCRIRVQ